MIDLSTDIKENTIPKAENESQSIFVPKGVEARQKLEEWIDKDLAKSGLTRDDMEIVPYYHAEYQKQQVNGYRIPFRYPNGVAMRDTKNHDFYRMRFMPPLPVNREGKNMKYGVPFGAGNHCYIPEAAHRALTEDPESILYLTEGEKKAAKATKSGLPTIGLPGIWNWMASKIDRGTEETEHKIHPDLDPYLTSGRTICLIYDSDARETKGKVSSFNRCAAYLAEQLDACGCILYRVDVPQDALEDGKSGLDDYLCNHTAEEFLQHIEKNKVFVSPDEALQYKDPFREITAEYGTPFDIKYTESGNVSKIHFNQSWNARFLAFKYKLLFEPDENNFYRYNPERGLWQQITEDKLKAILAEDLKDYWKSFHRGDWNTLVSYASNGMLKESIQMLRGVVEKRGAFEHKGPRRLIHLKSGMLDLDKQVIRDFAPEFYSRNQIPLDYDSEATCPRFLNDLLGAALDNDAIEAFQKYAGMSLQGGNDAQQFLLLEGTAGGGKGTLVEIVKMIVGEENIAELRTMHANERFEFSGYIGKTLLIGADVPGNFLSQKGSECLKKLTGGDLLDVEFKHANGRAKVRGEFCTIITSNNSLTVRIDGDNDAWKRRMILLRFVNNPPEKPIARFAEKLFAEEGAGILNWMVQGSLKYLEDLEKYGKIRISEKLQAEVDDLLFKSDPVHNFVIDCIEPSEGDYLESRDAFKSYISYCNSNGFIAGSKSTFFRSFAKEMGSQFHAVPGHQASEFGDYRGYRNYTVVG